MAPMVNVFSLSLSLQQRCCGVLNYTDWYGIEDEDFQTMIPDSCCDGPNCGQQGATVAYNIVSIQFF